MRGEHKGCGAAANLSQKVAIEKNLGHDAAGNNNAVTVGDEIAQTLNNTHEEFRRRKAAPQRGHTHLLDPGFCLIGRAVHIEAVLKRRGHYNTAARVGQVVGELGAIKAASEKVRLVGVD